MDRLAKFWLAVDANAPPSYATDTCHETILVSRIGKLYSETCQSDTRSDKKKLYGFERSKCIVKAHLCNL